MTTPLLTHDGELLTGTVTDRPNRFVVTVTFDNEPERVFLGDPGALNGIIEPGTPILCAPVDGDTRKTDYDAVAAAVDGTYISLKTALANDLFAQALERNLLDNIPEYTTAVREPPLPTHGRTDFRLDGPNGEPKTYIEVKSCTHVNDGIAKFPDRQTKRGRRHLRSLKAIQESGVDCQIVFVIQRPDVKEFTPFRTVDPDFADLLAQLSEAGVRIRALTTEFDPPQYSLREPNVEIRLG